MSTKTKKPTTTTTAAPLRNVTGSRFGLGHVHRDPLITAALATDDGWATARAALDRLDQSDPFPVPAPIAPELTARVLDALDAGKPVPADLPAQVTAAEANVNGTNTARQIVAAARAALIGRLDDALEARWDDVLTTLHDDLTDTLDAIRALGNLDELTDADTAVSAGRGEDYRTLDGLLERHEAIRQAQDALRRAEGIDPEHPEAAIIRDVERTFPHWADWRRAGYYEQQGRTVLLSPPWPHRKHDDQRVDLGTITTPPFVLWAVRHDVPLWVPTRAEYADEDERLSALRRGEQNGRTLARTYATSDHTPSGITAVNPRDPWS